MEKYGVSTRPAANCPDCSAALERHGTVLLCPEHGSKPLEKPKKPSTSTNGVDTVGTGESD